MADEIDYKLIGDDLQAVIITLDPGEMVIAEAGAMMYMQDGIVMNTTLDPNAQGGGLLGKLFQGAKRALSGDTLLRHDVRQRRRTSGRTSRSRRTFRARFARWICASGAERSSRRRTAFLCAARGANVTIAFTKRIGAGFFGGEGFILQRIEGDGLAFLHASGTLARDHARAGRDRCASTPAASSRWSSRCDYDIEMVPGIKTALFGGEGFSSRGSAVRAACILQTMPFSRLADRIIAAAPRAAASERVGGLGAAGHHRRRDRVDDGRRSVARILIATRAHVRSDRDPRPCARAVYPCSCHPPIEARAAEGVSRPPARARRRRRTAGCSLAPGAVASAAARSSRSRASISTVNEGEFFGLLGPNGAGKTTTIGILTTRVTPDLGHGARRRRRRRRPTRCACASGSASSRSGRIPTAA